MARDSGDSTRDLLPRRGHLGYQAQLMRTDFLDRFERTHRAVLPVDPDMEQIILRREAVTENHLDTGADFFAKPRGPVVDLADDERVAYRTDQDALISNLLGAFEFHGVARRGQKFASGYLDRRAADRLVA